MNNKYKGKNVRKKENSFEDIRKKLTILRLKLIKESKAEIGQILNEGDKYNGVSDDGDLADMAFRDSMQGAKLTRDQIKLKTIEEALRRFDEGTYGICEDCEAEIPVGRLNAMPFALRCVECQEKHEIITPRSEELVISNPVGRKLGD